MGNLCSKSSNQSDPFAQPGRVLGSSAQSPSRPRAATPQRTATSEGRTLGGRQGTAGDARSAAAKAAEERAQKLAARAASGGKLASQLETQKKQTRNELLAAGSEEERRARAIDEIAETARHD